MSRDSAPLFAGIGGHHRARSRTDEWLTPPEIIDALGGWRSFDLDPCAPAAPPWPTARHRYGASDNGLLLPWFGRVWLNPPYSTSALAAWMSRMAAHGRGTALIFARTETTTFFRYVWEVATGALFVRGRLNFHLPDGRRAKLNSGAPSVLIAYGRRDADMLAASPIDGQFVALAVPRSLIVAALTPTWRQLVATLMAGAAGPVRLGDLYRAAMRHPKARRNRNVEAKVRQQLQAGPYRRVGPGEWERADVRNNA